MQNTHTRRCIHTHALKRTHTHTHVHTHRCIHTHALKRTHAPMHTLKYTTTHTRAYTHTDAYTQHVLKHTCAHAHVHTHTHTHIRTRTRTRTDMNTYTHMRIPAHSRVHTHRERCIHTRPWTHTHTHTCTHSHSTLKRLRVPWLAPLLRSWKGVTRHFSSGSGRTDPQFNMLTFHSINYEAILGRISPMFPGDLHSPALSPRLMPTDTPP